MTAPTQSAGDTPARWMHETLYPAYRQSLRVDKMLFEANFDLQTIELFENADFGRVLALDGVVQTTERDEFIYHEMMTHTPVMAHGAVRRALIIGGGDGGIAREMLRHAQIERVTMIEIDASVVDFSKTHLPTLSNGAFDDPRLDLRIADGAAFMRDSDETFDVIVVDSTDPIGPGAILFTHEFYAHARARLNPGGIIVTQNGVPFMQGDELAQTMGSFKALFADYAAFMACVPTYACGPMALGWGCDDPAKRAAPLETLEARWRKAGIATRYYNPRVHLGAFMLPTYIQALIP